MDDGFQQLTFRGVLKDQPRHGLPVELAFIVQNVVAKNSPNLRQSWRPRPNNFPCQFIRTDYRNAGLLKHPANCALTRRDTSSQSYNQHLTHSPTATRSK